MNLPQNLSPVATRIYQFLISHPEPQTATKLLKAFTEQSFGEEPKAIATANSLVIKGIIGKEEENGEAIYSLMKQPTDVKPEEEYTGDSYVEGDGKPATSEANAEEQRMIDLLQVNNKKLPEAQLFELYNKEQSPANDDGSNNTEEVEKELKELTEAGVITKDGDGYSVKR